MTSTGSKKQGVSHLEINPQEVANLSPSRPATGSKTAATVGAQRLCQIPIEKGPDSVIVTTDDYATLEDGKFLNDIIIDFYLTYMHQNLSKEDRDSIYIFSTFFFLRITSNVAKDKTESERRYSRVARWTKNVDLFSKNMVIFPICENSHWFLIIAVKPGHIQLPVGSEERKIRGKPFLLLLDSMDGNRDEAVAIIRTYLAEEWKAKKGSQASFGKKMMRLVNPSKPLQNKNTDCGLYLLNYVEKIFSCVAQFYFLNLPDLTNWFPQEEIQQKRGLIACIIKILALCENPDNARLFPDLAAQRCPGTGPAEQETSREGETLEAE